MPPLTLVWLFAFCISAKRKTPAVKIRVKFFIVVGLYLIRRTFILIGCMSKIRKKKAISLIKFPAILPVQFNASESSKRRPTGNKIEGAFAVISFWLVSCSFLVIGF